MKYLGWTLLAVLLLGPQFLAAQRRAVILDHKDRVRITPLSTVNSRYRETNLSITPDGKYLYFMSLRGGQAWSHKFMTYKGDSVYDGDIWYSRKVGDRWQAPRCMPYGINSAEGEDEPHISADGRTVYFQSWNSTWFYTGGPYYSARRQGSRWGPKKGLGGGITKFFHLYNATDGMSISPDERIFVVAAGRDYDGNMDLYLSRRSSRGWGKCRRMSISTPGDERSAFVAADNQTVYFASDGYQGLGGLDIYKATLNADGSIGEVINIGAPFNTPKDDYGFILTEDGNEAYFVRNGNIYFADLHEADSRIKPGVMPGGDHRLTGRVRDSASLGGVAAEVVLLDARTKRLMGQARTSEKGYYEIAVPNQAKVYDEVVKAEGYFTKRRRVTVRPASSGKTYTANFMLSREVPPAPPVAVADPESATSPSPAEPAKEEKAKEEKKDEPAVPAIAKVDPKPTSPPQEAPKPTLEAPKVDPIEQEPEDPYSFEGVAKNNLTLLLDVSASMQGSQKLPLLKDALRRMLQHMRPEDQISIIAYAGDVDIVLDGVSAAQRETITQAIEGLYSAGSTDSKGAMRKAMRLARNNYLSGGNNRIIFATDGSFDVASLYRLAGRVVNDQVVLSVFSFGRLADYKEERLMELARRGGGDYTNITHQNVDVALLKEARAVRE